MSEPTILKDSDIFISNTEDKVYLKIPIGTQSQNKPTEVLDKAENLKKQITSHQNIVEQHKKLSDDGYTMTKKSLLEAINKELRDNKMQIKEQQNKINTHENRIKSYEKQIDELTKANQSLSKK